METDIDQTASRPPITVTESELARLTRLAEAALPRTTAPQGPAPGTRATPGTTGTGGLGVVLHTTRARPVMVHGDARAPLPHVDAALRRLRRRRGAGRSRRPRRSGRGRRGPRGRHRGRRPRGSGSRWTGFAGGRRTRLRRRRLGRLLGGCADGLLGWLHGGRLLGLLLLNGRLRRGLGRRRGLRRLRRRARRRVG